MRATASAPWTCTQCGRTVPAREPRCHCGLLRVESAGASRVDDGAGTSAGTLGRTLLVLLLVAAAGYGFYAAIQQREERIQAAAAAQQDRIRIETTPAGGEGPRPAATTAPVLAPSPYTPPAGVALPSPRAETSPPVLKRPGPADDSSPAPSSMEEAWARATDLLESPLQKVTAETAELQQQYAPFASSCLASPDANWLVAMKSGAFVRGGMPYSKFGVTVDCEFARRELVARGNVLKAELAAAESLAHSHRVLPGHWRKLLETHQLEIWDAY
jgi:hypothetical protein